MPIPHHQIQGHYDWTKEALRGAQRSCGTERFYCEESQTSAFRQPWKAPRITLDGTYGKDNAPLRGCILLLLILNSLHNTATDRRWARFHFNTSPAKTPALLTILSSNLRCGLAAEQDTAEQYSKTGRTKVKRSRKHRSLIKYLSWPSHDTNPLRCSSGNKGKMLVRSHLSLKSHTQYYKDGKLLQVSSIQSKCGWLGTDCWWSGDYHSLSLTRIQFHPPQVTPHSNPVNITVQGLQHLLSHPEMAQPFYID